MPLHIIDDQGNLQWHCEMPDCDHHNCSTWGERECIHHAHLPVEQRPQGQTHTAHISHEEIRYTDTHMVALPICSCGAQKFINTNYSEQDLEQPIIERDGVGITKATMYGLPIVENGQITPHIMRMPFSNAIAIRHHMERRQVAVNPQDLPPGDHQLVLKGGQFFLDASVLVIDDVAQNPVVARHYAFHQQLQAIGKTYKPEE